MLWITIRKFLSVPWSLSSPTKKFQGYSQTNVAFGRFWPAILFDPFFKIWQISRLNEPWNPSFKNQEIRTLEIECCICLFEVNSFLPWKFNITLCIVGGVQVQKSTWFLDDKFLREMMHTYIKMRKTAVQKNRSLPYLYNNYNIEAQVSPCNSNVRLFLARIIKAFVAPLNNKWGTFHLTRYIMIFLDKDLITAANVFDYGVSRTFEDTIKWLLINLNAIIETRKDDLMGKRAGAVSTSSEPSLIWVHMLWRPEGSDRWIYSLTQKFNIILHSVICGDKCSHSLKINIDCSANNFDRIGNLSRDGRIAYWKQLDNTMREFERGKTELRPDPPQFQYWK